jgi:hypothetical protein
LTVARHRTLSSFTSARATALLGLADDYLRSDDGFCDDVTCCVLFVQQGTMGIVFEDGDQYNIVGTSAELQEVFAQPYNIKVIQLLQYCEEAGGVVDEVWGCARENERNAVIEGSAPASVWAHEIGHMAGLLDNDGCTGLVMNSVGGETNTAVRSLECPYFLNGANRFGAENLGCGTDVGAVLAVTGAPSRISLAWEESDKSRSVIYLLSRSESCWGPLSPVATIASHDPAFTSDSTHYTYVDTGASYMQTYYYVLSTGDESISGAGAPSSGQVPAAIGAPTNLQGSAIYRGNQRGTVSLNWGASSGTVSGYYVYRAQYAGMDTCTSTHEYLGIASTNSYQDTTAPWNGAPVSYRVRAFNATTGSAVSNEAVVQTTPIPNEWVPDGIVVTSASGDQQNFRSIPDGLGGAIAVWEDRRAGERDIYVQRVDGAGHPLWTPNGVAVCTATYNQLTPVVVSDGSGGAIIAWHDERNNNLLGDIYAQRIGSSGFPLWVKDGVAVCTAASYQQAPDIAKDGAGGAIIAWQDNRNGTYDIYAQRLNASGAPQWTTDGVVIVSAPIVEVDPKITADGSGGAIIVWRDSRNGCNCAGSADVYVQRVNSAGATQWTANGIALCTAVNDQFPSGIVSDGGGGAIVVWEDQRTSTFSSDIFAQRVNASGTPVWTPDGIALCTASGLQRAGSTVPDGLGGAIAAWEDWRLGSADIYAQRVDSLGNGLWASDGIAICSAINDQRAPSISSDGGQGAVVAWEDDRAGGSTTDIYVQRVGSSGSPLWPIDGIALSTATSVQRVARGVTDGVGGAIAMWEDSRSGNVDIYAQRATPQGTSTILTAVDTPPPPASHVVLEQNRPNPFNPQTLVVYSLPHRGRVRLDVLDVQGRLVRRLVDADAQAGPHRVQWSAENDRERPVASGIYFLRLEFDGSITVRRMALLR